MESPLPFFYYDILARIVPGAVTLAVLWQLRAFRAIAWLKAFAASGDKDGWEKLVMPFVLVGLCYAIGVVFEVLDYVLDVDIPDDGKSYRRFERRFLNFMMEISVYLDDRAFFWAVRKRGSENDKKELADWKESRKRIRDRRSDLWERLTYQGGSDERKKLIFAHCHRFQSEQKMFLHLIYPALLFALLWWVRFRSYYPDPFPIQDVMISLAAIAVLGLCCRSRCRRRWLQVVTFSVMIEAESGKMQDTGGR